MRGAIIGDIIGSAFVNNNLDVTDFQLLKPLSAYTDNTISTLSTADAVLHNKDFGETLKQWVRRYPTAGYKETFLDWALSDKKNSYQGDGDGAARRISPIGYAAPTLEYALQKAEEATVITHNIPIRIEASRAYAGAIFLAKQGKSKDEIKEFIESEFHYKLNLSLADIQNSIRASTDLATPVPAAVIAFLASDDFEDAIRKAVWIGGPSHTIASITGGISQAYYNHLPKFLVRKTLNRLKSEMEATLEEFEAAFLVPVI